MRIRRELLEKVEENMADSPQREALRNSLAVSAKVEVKGAGRCAPPAFTREDLAAIQARADAIEDQQTKTDLFRLIAEVERIHREP